MTAFGCVVLTTGRRPAELRRALESLLAQEGVELDVVVVGNGWDPVGLPAGVRGVWLPEDRGIPAGRNAGVPHVRGELLFFLDDDAFLDAPQALASVRRELAGPDVGAVQLRVEPSDGRAPLREWVSYLRMADRERTGDITALWEGAVGMRRDVFDRAGGWPAEFRFVHEGVDLAWRVMDLGYRVRYLADVIVRHPTPDPAAPPARHGYSHRYAARNRVLLARRHLPLPLGLLFVLSFAVRTVPRLSSPGAAREAARGYLDGLRHPRPRRRKLRLRTIWRMTRAGRPPII